MNIAAYCRVSTDSDDQLNSFAHQKEFFSEYANKNGYTLYKTYADEGISGTSLKKRIEFQCLMKDAERGLFKMVVVKDVSRFARNTVDFLQSIRKLKSMGINTVFLTANMTSLGDSEFMLTIFGAMAQEESANLSKRVKWGKKIAAKNGCVPNLVFGYDHIDAKTLQINTEEAEIVQKIFHWYAHEGWSLKNIAIWLNENHVKTKRGGEVWNKSSVCVILDNSIYCGVLVNNKTEVKDFLSQEIFVLPKEEHFRHEKPELAIISREEFDLAQEVREFKRKQIKNHGGKMASRPSTKHLFSTLIKCDNCGSSFVRLKYHYKEKTKIYWQCNIYDQWGKRRCNNNFRLYEDQLIENIREYLLGLLSDKEKFIDDIIKSAMKDAGSTCDADIKKIMAERDTLTNRREKYQEMYANNLMTLHELKTKIEQISTRLLELNADMESIEQISKTADQLDSIVRKYTCDIKRFLALETPTNLELRRIIDHINVSSDRKVTIVLRKIDI